MASPLRYKKTPGFATTCGQQYEVNLAALLFLRGLNSGLDFQLGTNVAGAGNLDDVVFRCKPKEDLDNWTTLFIQLKHKTNRPVSRQMLTNPKGDFSLPKYFEAYLEIKQAMFSAETGTLFDGSFEKCVFVIFTNATANTSVGREHCENLSSIERLLWSDSGNVFSFEEDEEILKCLGECGEEGGRFLSRLRVFCDQPRVNGLKAIVRDELHNVNDEIIHGVDIGRLCDIYLDNAKVWWESSNDILHQDHDLFRRAVGMVRLESSTQKTRAEYRLDVEFDEDAVSLLKLALTQEYDVLTIASSKTAFRLSFTKLLQAIDGQPLILTCLGLLANKSALLDQWRKGDFKSIMICTGDWSSGLSENILETVKDLRAIRNTSFILFLTNAESCVASALTREFQESAKLCFDEFKFSQLTVECRERILEKQINLQGHNTVLRRLLDDPCANVDSVLDAASVVEIMECAGRLTLGAALTEGIGYYVDRSLELATALKVSVFKDALKETVTIRVMKKEASADIENFKPSDSKEVSRDTDSMITMELTDMAFQFLSSLNDSPSGHNVDNEAVGNSLSQLPSIFPEKVDRGVYICPEFLLGLFVCNYVRLRFGESDTVTALRVRTGKNALKIVYLLFVFDKTSKDDVRKLSDFHQSKHLLSLKDGQLHWIQSHGDIELIRKHVDEEKVIRFAPNIVTDVTDRVVLVCAEPGMGKSTLMARLANNTKAALPHYFVISIALNDHTQLFAQGKHEDVLGFLTTASKIESHLHQSLLKYALNVSGNVVVLFDGYDEIAPTYVKQSCDLLLNLRESKASKIWVTSRNSTKNHLETHVSKISVKLRKFDVEDQRIFLKRYWMGKSLIPETDLDAFISQLLEKTSRIVRDKEKDFMGIPLQTQMLAEVYGGHVTGAVARSDLPDNLDLLVLLEQFVDKKCSVYVEAKLKIPCHDTNYEELCTSSKKRFNDSHSKAALILILGDDVITSLRMDSIITESLAFFEDIQRGKDKTGFIDDIVNDRPRFVHRVFAEYFAAKWISEHFAVNVELIKSKMFTTDFAVIRNIFNRILARDRTLHTAVLNEDFTEVETLLERQEVDVNSEDSGGRTALHLAAGLGTSKVWEENERRGKILDLLIDKNSDFNRADNVLGGSPLQYADFAHSWVAIDKFLHYANDREQFALTLANVTNHHMLDTIFELDLKDLLVLCLDNGLTVEHCSEGERRLLLRACEVGCLNVASILIEKHANIYNIKIENEDSEYEDKDFFSSMNNTPLFLASSCGEVDIVKLLNQKYLSTIGEGLNFDVKDALANIPDISAYVKTKDRFGMTAIHYAAWRGHSDVISYLISQGVDPRTSTRRDNTPLHVAAERRNIDALKVLLEAVDEADRAAAVNASDFDGDGVLSCAALGGCLETIGLVVQAGGKLSQVRNNKRTPLMVATEANHGPVVRYLLDAFDSEREGMSRWEYINMMDNDGKTALDLANAECLEVMENCRPK